MRFTDVLRGHVDIDDDRKKHIWDVADFCLDTNVLLDVYRYTEENRVAFLKLLGALKGRMFIPNRVAVEFARNRITVIREHFAPQRVVTEKLEQAAKEIRDKFSKHPLLDELQKVIGSAKLLVNDQYGEAEKQYTGLIHFDTILQDLLTVIGDEVGDPYPESEALKEYKRRKDGKIPPYCQKDDQDKSSEAESSGDVVIWLELLKQYQETKKPLIFVTGTKRRIGGTSEVEAKKSRNLLLSKRYIHVLVPISFSTHQNGSAKPPRIG